MDGMLLKEMLNIHPITESEPEFKPQDVLPIGALVLYRSASDTEAEAIPCRVAEWVDRCSCGNCSAGEYWVLNRVVGDSFILERERLGKGKIVQVLSTDAPIAKEGSRSFSERRAELYSVITELMRDGSYEDRCVIRKLYSLLNYGNDGNSRVRVLPTWFFTTVAISLDNFQHISWARDVTHVDNDTRRRHGRIATFLRYIVHEYNVDFTQEEIDRISYIFGTKVFSHDDYEFEIVRGDDVYVAYENGPESCMRGHRAVQFYVDNPDTVGLVKIYRGHGENRRYMGRSLVWKTDQGTIGHDRIYPTDGGAHVDIFRRWAKGQGWVDFYGSDDRRYSVTMRKNTNNVWPYMDTFSYLKAYEAPYVLFNGKSWGEYGQILDRTDGTLNGYDENGYDENGYDENGYNRDGYDENGYDEDGYDENGYDEDGYGRDGYNRDGYLRDGYDGDGYDEDGYNRDGYDEDGYNRDGYDENGYDEDGYDIRGYNARYETRDGYRQEYFLGI